MTPSDSLRVMMTGKNERRLRELPGLPHPSWSLIPHRCDARQTPASLFRSIGASHVPSSLIELDALEVGGSLVPRPSLIPRPGEDC
jgi:hypothetical protein